MNGLYYGRGTSTIYDSWVSLGNPGWSWNEVYPLFIKVCRVLYGRKFNEHICNPNDA
jgi:hypothetical protein